MTKKRTNNTKLIDLILPNKKINIFVITVLMLGVISGSIFLMMSNSTDKTSVTTQINNFLLSISNDTIDNGLALRNSLIINYIFVFLIFVLGLSMIGILVNIFLTYIKGFLVGFSISSIFLTYGAKGILPALLYTFPHQLINVIVITVLTIYSIMFASSLFKIIVSKKNINNRTMLKKYLVILMFSVVISFISSFLEVYLFPNLLKLVVKFYL